VELCAVYKNHPLSHLPRHPSLFLSSSRALFANLPTLTHPRVHSNRLTFVPTPAYMLDRLPLSTSNTSIDF
jgi:hypothetical protein